MSLLEALRKSDLEVFFVNFTSRGVKNLDDLSQISVHNYSEFGIHDIEDRKRLFSLTQSLQNNKSSALPILDKRTSSPARVFSAASSHALQKDRISVCVRKRPLGSKELNRGERDICDVSNRIVILNEEKLKVDLTPYVERHKFVFDEVFDCDATNDQVIQLF
jgi:hypothetical protein